MFDAFSHYLAYGATDQQTARDLAGVYDGLLVPGTVAAFQREGTGGFVLTLSATSEAPDYVIDPRFPLFQQALVAPKKSHEALAELLEDPGLVSPIAPAPGDFPPDRTEQLARAWVDFNRGYSATALAKFKKYADRLGEPVAPEGVQEPAEILALYLTAGGPADPWWNVSSRLFEQSAAYEPDCLRVVAAKESGQLGQLLAEIGDERVVVWASGLEELLLSADDLAVYGRAIKEATERGIETFALYGGFFHVLLAGVGLRGASHGIGYGEYRMWLELPQSGPPPPRYYVRRIHRYVSQELAHQLYVRDMALVACDCEECRGQSPLSLDYHALMKHSVRARALEIDEWAGKSPVEAAALLEAEFTSFGRAMRSLNLPPFLAPQADRSYDHLDRWARALRLLV